MQNALPSSPLPLPRNGWIAASRVYVDAGSTAAMRLSNPPYSNHARSAAASPQAGCMSEHYGGLERRHREESSEHTSLLIPLRDRDVKELKALFADQEIEAIETDIIDNLLRRCPEPCWEDDPFEFLQDYL